MTTNFAKSAVSTLVLAVAALGAASSFAGTSDVKGTEGEMLTSAFTSTTTRAAVQSDLIRAAKSGQIIASIAGTTLKAPEFMSSRSAAEVRAEAVVAAHHPVVGTI
jgi:hypothetical protein